MNLSRSLSWALLAVCLCAIAGLFWWLNRTPTPAPEPNPPTPMTVDTPAPVGTVPAVTEPQPVETPTRTAVETQTLEEAQAREKFGQGVRGKVVDEHDRPLGDVWVYLIESPSNDPLALPAMLQQGLAPGPTTSTRSAFDGTFALGLPVATDRLYEVHLLARQRADTRITGVRLLPAQWHDLGDLVMQRGATVRGRVTVEGSELPVPQATVTMLVGTVFDDTVLRALPGRENGLCAAVDANGFYAFENAPVRGAVQLTAVAPGFAAVVRQNVQLSEQQPTEEHFGLRPGHSLGGVLVDADSRPVVGARVEAWPMQSPGQPLLTHSLADGSFTVHGLGTGNHRLRVLARGFQNVDVPDLVPTRLDLRITLLPRANLVVAARTAQGAALHTYQLAVRRYFPSKDPARTATSQGDLGLLPDVPEQRVRLDRLTDTVVVPGIPPGTFVCQVIADGYAKTLSEPFEVTTDTREVRVDVVVGNGATVRGIVFDATGAPLGGVTITTQAQGSQPDNPLWRILAGASPGKVTTTSVQSGPDGRFELRQLALGTYELVFDHPGSCRTLVQNLDLHQQGPVDVPPVRLAAGARVHGQVTVGGKIRGQVKVILVSKVSAAASPGPPSNPPQTVRLEALCDEQGHYELPRRVPAGDYELRGLVLASADSDSQAIHQMLQMQRSAIPVTVTAGRDEVTIDFDLPTGQ